MKFGGDETAQFVQQFISRDDDDEIAKLQSIGIKLILLCPICSFQIPDLLRNDYAQDNHDLSLELLSCYKFHLIHVHN